MMDSEKRQLIERYLLEQLSVEETNRFNQFLADPAFKEEVAFQKEIMDAVEYRGDKHLRSVLKQKEDEIKKSEVDPPGKTFPIRRIISIAAAILLLVIVAWQFLKPPPVNLFAENFSPQVNTLYPIKKSADQPTDIEKTFSLYETGRYQEALAGFEKSLSENENDDVAFYQANALLAVGKIADAIPILQRIIQNNNSDYLSAAKWYLALSYIAQKNYADAKPLLIGLKQDPFLQKKATELLEAPVFD